MKGCGWWRGRNGPQDVPQDARSARISEVAVRRVGRLGMGLPPGLGLGAAPLSAAGGGEERGGELLDILNAGAGCLGEAAHDQRLQIGGKVRDSIAQADDEFPPAPAKERVAPDHVAERNVRLSDGVGAPSGPHDLALRLPMWAQLGVS